MNEYTEMVEVEDRPHLKKLKSKKSQDEEGPLFLGKKPQGEELTLKKKADKLSRKPTKAIAINPVVDPLPMPMTP